MLFADIKGLTEVKGQLISAVKNNHIAHAHLFLGNEGSANLAMALAFATYLNCGDRKDDDACGVCPSCSKSKKFIHPDVHFVFPVAATKKTTGKEVSSTMYLNEWRAFLKENVYGNLNDWNDAFGGESKQATIVKEESRNIIRNLSLKAFEGNYKIMLIWLPEYMNVQAANSLLKILEEPPEKTIFLMVSNDAEKLLVTILSRVQAVKIRAFDDGEIKQILMSELGMDENKAKNIATLAEGNLNEAKKLATEVEDDTHKMFRDWMRLCYSCDFTQLFGWSETFQKMNKLSQKSLFQYGLTMMREALIQHYKVDTLMRVSGEEAEFIKKFSQVMSIDKIEKITSELNLNSYYLERNANPKITFMDLSLTIMKTLRG